MPVKAVVFDLGGVLIDWDPRYLYRKLLADEAAVEEFLATVCTMEWTLEHERWPEMLGGDIPGAVELLAELRAAGVPLYALTNWSADTFGFARERFGFLGWFDGILVSGEERLVKPDPAIFELLAERFGLDPRETFYVDDSEVNVAAARELGFDAVSFTGPQRLRRDLAARRLLARPAPTARPSPGTLRP